MTSGRSRTRKSTQKRKRQSAVRAAKSVELPRELQLIVDSHELLGDYVKAARDPQAALDLAEKRLAAALDELVALMAPYYPMDVFELVHLRNVTADPETYRETEHDGNLSAVELVGVVAATLPADDANRPLPGAVADHVQEAALRCLEAASMRVLFASALQTADPLAPISFGSQVREVGLRNTEYPHMLRDTLQSIFSAPTVEADLVQATGLTIAEVLSLIDAAAQVRATRWPTRLNQLAGLGDLARAWPRDASAREKAREEGRAIIDAVFGRAADAAMLEPSELAGTAGVSPDKATAFLELFTADLHAATPISAAQALLSGDSPIRTRPILADKTGRRLVSHSSLLVSAVRSRLEDALAAAGLSDRYLAERGNFVEAEAVRLVTGVVPAPDVRVGFEYFVPDPDSTPPQDGPGCSPAGYTKLVEGDGLIVVDDIAVIVETKAVNVSPGTRKGFLGGIRRNLRRVLTEVVDQADRMRTRIETDKGLRLRDGTWVDLSGVREVHSIAVTLEDLSGLATVTSQLVDAGLITAPVLPWVVSLHDLRIVTELVDRPADLVFFLRRRTVQEATRRFHAVDELDFYMHFLGTGLYFEPDPDAVHKALPHLPAPTTADRRRYAKQGLEFLTSRTGPLDDWYFHKLGVRMTSADKPTLAGPQALMTLVDEISATGKPGAIATGVALLELSFKARREVLAKVPVMLESAAGDSRRHTMTFFYGVDADNLPLLVFAILSTSDPDDDLKELQRYVLAKKHQTKATTSSLIILDATGRVTDLYYDNSPSGPNADLDELGRQLGLRPLERSRPLPPSAKPKAGGARRGKGRK